MKRIWAVVGLFLAVATADAATIVLKNGSIIEGEIIARTSATIRIRTPYDIQLIRRRDIDKVYDEDDEAGVSGSSSAFEDLPEKIQALFNARADYALGRYARVIERIEPFAATEKAPSLKSAYNWLLINAHERQADWDKVRQMLEAIQTQGTQIDKNRAKAHLDILDDNKDYAYSLRRVDKAWSRNFLPLDMRDPAQDPNALARAEMMDQALREYCKQLVHHEEEGIEAFRKSLDRRKTYDAIKKLPKGIRPDDVLARMPYKDALRRAQTAINKAQAVFPGFVDAFQLDLVRAEGQHLVSVLERLLGEAVGASPYNITLPKDTRGQITAAGRRQWREACRAFLDQTAPVEAVGEYFLLKINSYPKELKLVAEIIGDVQERLVELRESVRRQMNR